VDDGEKIKNCFHEEIKSRLNPENVCNLVVQNVFSSRLLSNYINIRTDKTILLSCLPVVLYGCET
jgi:hypothetical protein